MIKKFILICVVGLLGIAVFAGPAWGYTSSSTTVWIAQMDTSSQPAQQPRPNPQTETSPATEQTAPKQTKTEQQRSPSAQKQSDKPFNPYDMKALKQFDAGDHRAK